MCTLVDIKVLSTVVILAVLSQGHQLPATRYQKDHLSSQLVFQDLSVANSIKLQPSYSFVIIPERSDD